MNKNKKESIKNLIKLLNSGQYELKRVVTDKVEKVEKKTVNKKVLRKCFDLDKFKYLVDLIKFREQDEKIKFNKLLLITLLYISGSRISEILLINKEKIKEFIIKNEVELYEPKTNKYRKIYFIEDMKRLIFEIFEIQNLDDFISKIDEQGIIQSSNKKIKKRTAYTWFEPYFILFKDKFEENKEIKINGNPWGFHSFRVNFATSFYNHSKDICLTQKVLGHTNIENTMRYIRDDGDDEKIKDILKTSFKIK